MDLEVVGRHALLFDDDSMASFVNSSSALVDWNDLLIDRYDVRHLLSSPPPRPKRRRTNSEDPDLESELEQERYLDLPADSPSPSQDPNDLNDVSKPTNAGGFSAVPFSYGSTSESSDQKNADPESGFHPPFPVPEYLLLNLMLGAEMELTKPPTEKLHQIIARTAIFVSKHGGQSEIVLRVKQGGNPTFGFLMPDHHLHPYFRFLVEHQELLSGKSFEEVKKNEGGQGSGALFLLGSVYGTGEDEDTKSEAGMDSKINEADEGDNDVKAAVCSGPDVSEGTTKLTAEGDTVSKHPLLVKDKASVIKGNPSVSTVNVGNMNKTGSEDGIPEKLFASADKLQSSVVQTQPKLELPIVEPPADMKKVIDKIVEFILRNGKEFEAILAAQDVKYGRFPFLLPASLYHAYYRKVLREAEEPNPSGKDNISEKRDKKQEKRAAVAKENGKPAVGSDIPDDSVKKEKFKMVIGKPKKDVQDEPPKPVQPNIGVTIDADAAAAILQAARRGIKNPNLGILSSNPLYETSSQGLGSDNSQPSSQPSSLMKNIGQTSEHRVSGPAANAIAKSAALAAASEADSSEAGLSKEQKLKAERLKRAKMFVSLLKSGAEPARSLSIEPPDSGNSGSGANAVEPAVREREGSSVPFEAEKKRLDDDNNERRSKRNYRSRAQKNEDDEKDEEEGNSREETEETGNDKQSSKRRHSEHKRDMQKNRKGRSSKDRHSRDRHKHDSSSDDERHKRSRHRHKHGKSCHKHELDDSSDNEHRRRHRSSKHKHAGLSDEDAHHQHRSSKHKNADSSDDEHQHRCRSSRHKHADDSSDDEHCNRDRSSKSKKEDYCEDECGHRHKHSKRRKREKERIKEEITLKGEESEGHCGGQNETTQVSEELRAKIRAMLTGTL